MRYLLPVLFIFAAGCAAQAATQDEACADVAITELPPIDIASSPPVEVQVTLPKRTIEIYAGKVMQDGVLLYETCSTENSDRSIDYNGCCPNGWHPLALGANGLICEED